VAKFSGPELQRLVTKSTAAVCGTGPPASSGWPAVMTIPTTHRRA